MKDRTFVVAGHTGSGKTTLIAQFLKLAGVIDRAERTLLDYDELEKEKGMTMMLKPFKFKYGGYDFQVIDTPGFIEFEGELISATRVADNMLIVVDVSTGIEVGIERAFEEARRHNLPTFFVINKVASYDKDPEELLQMLKEKFGKQVHPVQLPIGRGENFSGVFDLFTGDLNSLPDDLKSHAEEEYTELTESVVETDDTLLEKFLEGEEISKDEIHDAMRKAIDEGLFYPVLYADAAKGVGVKELLDFLGEYGLSFGERQEDTGTTAALVFKTYAEPHMGEVSVFRVFSGKVVPGTELLNVNKESKERIAHVYTIFGREKKEINEAGFGEIGILVKLKNTETGDTLADPDNPVKLDWVEMPEPLYVLAIKPRTKKDEDKLSEALQKLMKEDPTFYFKYDPQLKQTLLYTQGEIHANTIFEKMKRKFNVEVERIPPRVPYRESIRKPAEATGKYVKQTGGRGQYGVAHIRIEPLPRGQGYEWVDKIFGGAIPREYRPYVEQGVKKAMEEGVLMGYPMMDIRVILLDGKYHEVDSSNMAFEIAGSMAFKEAAKNANPYMLEPIYEVEIYTPEENISDVIAEVNSRRGRIMNIGQNKIEAQMPLAELYDFLPALRSKTRGRGRFKMKFSHYEEVSQDLVKHYPEEEEK